MQKYVIIFSLIIMSVQLHGMEDVAKPQYIGGIPVSVPSYVASSLSSKNIRIPKPAQTLPRIFQLPEVEVTPKTQSLVDKICNFTYKKIRSSECWVDWGSDVNKVRSDTGVTPLVASIRNKNAEAVKLLLENGASIDAAPLIEAVKSENFSIVRLLTAAGADWNVPFDAHSTPLSTGIILDPGVKNCIKKYLIKNGVDFNTTDCEGKTALGTLSVFKYLRPAMEQDPKIIRSLLRSGAHLGDIKFNFDPNVGPAVGPLLDHETRTWGNMLPFLTQLRNRYYRHTQPRSMDTIAEKITSGTSLAIRDLTYLIAQYSALRWEEYVELNKRRNNARGRALAAAGVENCDIN